MTGSGLSAGETVDGRNPAPVDMVDIISHYLPRV